MIPFLLLLAIFFTPSSAVTCYSCNDIRNITCEKLEITPDRGFSRYECTYKCNNTMMCDSCQVSITNTESENFYKMSSSQCRDPNSGKTGVNETCAAFYSIPYSNSTYIESLFTRDYKNTSSLPQDVIPRKEIFPVSNCACDTSLCNNKIQISFLHYATTSPTTTTRVNTITPTTVIPPIRPLVLLPPEYLALIAAALLILFILSVLLTCPFLIWRCYSTRDKFSYRPANDKNACPQEMATLSSPERRFNEDPELAGVPVLTGIHLSELIGSGKYGHVWRCTYEGKEMACKVWLTSEMNSWRSERAIFSQETTYHPNIVRYIHSGFIEENDHLGVVRKGALLMELCSRGSLSNLLDTSTLSWDMASRFSFEIASGIGYLHSHTGLARADRGYTAVEKCPIAHRDIKSSNVLIRGNMSCCVSDLGLAIALNPNSSEESFANAGQVGTPVYMAPEILDAKINFKNLDSFKQMDVFSLGLVLWEIFCRCQVENGPTVSSQHKIPFFDHLYTSISDKARMNRTQVIYLLRELHQNPIENLLAIPREWKEHPLMSRARTTILDCTHKDPEARISTGTVTSRFEQSMPSVKHNENERSFCESIDFGSFASMSSLMRMIDTQRLSRINYENLSQLPENSV